MTKPEPALVVSDLSVGYRRPNGAFDLVVFQVSFELHRGRILGLAGESGCGKTTVSLISTGYRPVGSTVQSGSAMLEDRDLLALPQRELRKVWGRRISYLPQNAASSLNPALTVGKQLEYPLRTHLGLDDRAIRKRQLELLDSVALPYPERALTRYPHQFSGGQQQRIALAIALSCEPQILILDEPTTGLDVTTQARISGLLQTLLRGTDLAALYVSHNLGLLAELTDDLAVMYGGEIVEQGATADVVYSPRHPYTRALLAAVPSARKRRVVVGIPGGPPSSASPHACPYAPRCDYVIDACRSSHVGMEHVAGSQFARCIRWHELPNWNQHRRELSRVDYADRQRDEPALLEVRNLSCFYGSGRSLSSAVVDVSFSVGRGQTLGIAGESGSGKSTLLRSIAGLHLAQTGSILLNGQPLERAVFRRSRRTLKAIQLVFQHPDLSLNPRRSVASTVKRSVQLLREGLSPADQNRVVREVLDAVKLPRSVLQKFPTELSGGQQQRVAIAAAFAAQPEILLCDEVTSALDVSVQATILELIDELAKEFATTIVMVSHDLGVIRTIADRALIMRNGELVDEGNTQELFDNPSHPYTRDLLGAVPELVVS